MKPPTSNFPQIAAYVPEPKPAPAATEESAAGKVLWASPELSKALGGSTLGSLPGVAKVYPLQLHGLVQPQGAGVSASIKQGVQFFDDAGISVDDVLHSIIDDSVKRRQLSATGGNLFSSTLAGAEIVLELTGPSDKSALEKALSISLNGIVALEPLTDWVPHLAHAKPYLLAIVDIGGEILAAVHTAAGNAEVPQVKPPMGAAQLTKL